LLACCILKIRIRSSVDSKHEAKLQWDGELAVCVLIGIAACSSVDQVEPLVVENHIGDSPKYLTGPETSLDHKNELLYGLQKAGKPLRTPGMLERLGVDA
jgi:hypothetical protein